MRIQLLTGLVFSSLAASIAAADSPVERRLPELIGQASGMAFSPDGKFLATVSDGYLLNGRLRVWNVATRRERTIKFDHPANLGISTVAWSPDGQWLATAYWRQVKLEPAGFVALLDVRTGNLINEWKASNGPTFSVAFSADGATIASGGADGRVRLWDVNSLKERRALKAADSRVYGVAFSADGRYLAAVNGDATVTVWDAAGKNIKFSVNAHNRIDLGGTGKAMARALAFSPDGARLAAGVAPGRIVVWDVASGRPNRPIELLESETVRSLAFRPIDNMLAIAAGPTVHLIDPDTRNESNRFSGYSENVYSLAFSPDGSLLAIGDRSRARLRSMTESDDLSSAGDAERLDDRRHDRQLSQENVARTVHSNVERDSGPWVVAAGAGLLVLLLGAVVMVCRRG